MRFSLDPHSSKPGIRVVNIWEGGTLMGAIYPTETGIKFISKYVLDPDQAIEIERKLPAPEMPAILINIK